MSTEPVGVVGASARAAVHSLARAGRRAWAIDLFGDRDLKFLAPVIVCPIAGYPDAIPVLAKQFPPGPVLYTGGLENHPPVVAELTATRALWGNPPDVLERVRDPNALNGILGAKGFALPRGLPPGDACPATGRWLMKSRRSSGGLGVREARPGERPEPNGYLQEFVAGASMSAVFVICSAQVKLIGVTEQLIGTDWLHARGFQYAGNVGPIEVSRRMERELLVLSELLTTEFGLRGIVGLDFISHDDALCVVEVNPRYPASAEVLEHATGRAIFGDPSPPSLLGNGAGGSGPPPRGPGPGPAIVGKAIYYTARRIVFPAGGPWDGDLAVPFDPWRLPNCADIPEAGASIEAGRPVLTIFAAGSSPATVRERLQSRAAELDALFAEC